MRKYYIKVITGFREDQQISIPMQEAHKAYYLFKHPEARGVFNNGVALIGKNIQEIKPDWNKTMGWTDTHELDSYDFLELRNKGVEEKMRELIVKAKDVAMLGEEKKELLQEKLQDCMDLLLTNSQESKLLADKFKI